MKNNLAALLVLAVAIVLPACSGGSRGVSMVMVGEKRAPIAWESVRVYGVMPKNAQPVADLNATSAGAMTMTDAGRLDAVVERMKKSAAEVGANGLWLADDLRRPETMTSKVAGSTVGWIPGLVGKALGLGKNLMPESKDYEFRAKAFHLGN